MSTSTSVPPAMQPPIQFANYEQCECTRCGSAIPQQNIVKNILKDNAYSATRQSVRAFCEHCDTMFVAIRILRGGVWEIEGKIETFTEGKVLEAFRRRLEAQRGDVHRGPAA